MVALSAAVICLSVLALYVPRVSGVPFLAEIDRQTCTATGERCAGAPGRPAVEWKGCCEEWPVSCFPDANAGTDDSKWGRYCKKLEWLDVKEKETLIPGIYTADPSAHVIDGNLMVYVSTDDPVENFEDPNEMHFLMTRYTILIFNWDLSKVAKVGEVLPLSSIPWAKKQLWAPDATCKGGKCYLYYPAKDYDDKFRLGAAVSNEGPFGPFYPEENYIQGTFSVDPAVYSEGDDSWLIWGGEWGGQLENWVTGEFVEGVGRPDSGPSLRPWLAKLKGNMLEIEEPKQVRIIDNDGNDISAEMTDFHMSRRFFEAPWIHKRNGVYYLTYSTGYSHLLVYAWSLTLEGPYRFGGTVMSPPEGWTTHHSIVKYNEKWYLFYHDSKTSGRTNLRQVKMQELKYKDDGQIIEMTP